MQARQLPGPHVSGGTGAADATRCQPACRQDEATPTFPSCSARPLRGLSTGVRGVQDWRSCGCHQPWVQSLSSRDD